MNEVNKSFPNFSSRRRVPKVRLSVQLEMRGSTTVPVTEVVRKKRATIGGEEVESVQFSAVDQLAGPLRVKRNKTLFYSVGRLEKP